MGTMPQNYIFFNQKEEPSFSESLCPFRLSFSESEIPFYSCSFFPLPEMKMMLTKRTEKDEWATEEKRQREVDEDESEGEKDEAN